MDSQIYALAARFTTRLCELRQGIGVELLAPAEFQICGQTEACACATQFVCGAVRLKIFRLKITFSKKSDTSEKLLRTESGFGYRLISPQQD